MLHSFHRLAIIEGRFGHGMGADTTEGVKIERLENVTSQGKENKENLNSVKRLSSRASFVMT
jgi:hypothetical protein